MIAMMVPKIYVRAHVRTDLPQLMMGLHPDQPTVKLKIPQVKNSLQGGWFRWDELGDWD